MGRWIDFRTMEPGLFTDWIRACREGGNHAGFDGAAG